jgi:hypothetical protein
MPMARTVQARLDRRAEADLALLRNSPLCSSPRYPRLDSTQRMPATVHPWVL